MFLDEPPIDSPVSRKETFDDYPYFTYNEEM